ncbi:hypothetical protein PFICI_07559 [Pestalotiopsis fici W106-1]|uniref:Uncharacterized protein n=1 Tax=Pestalotiopsis fici (strain W106-1 / CGMCC3.15140) TaxID=1229662 RepID=W3X1S9_PESFW|nr:uncharacterized protein PFICI_07559 [Pestalotiopsis fici W106-1]ETS80030.1 hypothetical protein PFICI_07559 [Pestalotiopsis fici W106-1]
MPKLTRLPYRVVVWGMLNMRGIALFGALYKSFHYILSPISAFDASDMRLTDMTYTGSALPSVLIAHFTTYLGALLGPDSNRRQIAGHLWALFPLWICFIQNFATRYILKPSTVGRDRLYNPTSDLVAIRRTVLILVAMSTISWQYTVYCGRASLTELFFPAFPVRDIRDLNMEGAYVPRVPEVGLCVFRPR